MAFETKATFTLDVARQADATAEKKAAAKTEEKDTGSENKPSRASIPGLLLPSPVSCCLSRRAGRQPRFATLISRP